MISVFIICRCILQIFSHKNISKITPRLIIKNLWKNLVFREVKVSKSKRIKKIEYFYINNEGLERSKIYNTIEEAKKEVPEKYHRNIIISYYDYYGFTTQTALRNNDKYYDREIFFSKKCYAELNFDQDNPTLDFYYNNEKHLNDVPPVTDQLICGLVENGEKGLFYRK